MVDKVLVAKVDATEEGELAKKYKISGFPTIKFFEAGVEAGAYQGEKSELGLSEWVESLTGGKLELLGSVLQETDSCDDLLSSESRGAEQVRYVALLESSSSSAFELLEQAGQNLRKHRVQFKIMAVLEETAARCREQAGCTGGGCWMDGVGDVDAPALLVSSVFLDSVEKLSLGSQSSDESIRTWMIEKSVPTVGDIDDDSSRKYYERKLPVFVAFLDPAADNAVLRAELARLSASYGKQFSFVTGDGVKYRQIISAMGMSTQNLPQIAIDVIADKDRPTYPYHRGKVSAGGAIAPTPEGLVKFVEDYLGGRLEKVEKQQQEDSKEPDGSDVHELDDQLFEQLKSRYEFTAVLFYAPWSSESLELMPGFRELATEFEDVGFGKNDITEPSEMNRDHSPNIPTVLLFRKGELVKESLPAEAVHVDGIRGWLSKHTAAGASRLVSSEIGEQWLEQPGPKVLAVLPAAAKQERSLLDSVASSERGFFAYAVVEPRHAPPGLSPGVWALLESGHKEQVATQQSLTPNLLRSQLQKLRVPTVLDFGPESGPTLSRFDEIPVVMVLLPSHDWDTNSNIVHAAGAAPRFAGRIIFLTINAAQMPQVGQSLGISNDPNMLPAVRIDGRQNKDRPGMFSPPKDFKLSASNLQQFADDYLAKRPLDKILRSADAPEVPRIENHLQVLVGSQFDSEVLEHDGDVAVYFYAPWCQFCTRFTPIFELFAKSSGSSGVKFMKMDSTENEPPEFVKVEGFPTVYLFKLGDKRKPVMFDGQPDEGGLTNFFLQESSGRGRKQIRLDDEL
eukprot:TRINITY_DN16939_c0_g2_i2.p1 TRINITY_DN16939_c0_g2~~TRINITY_DN16939_c0_g2_i2.p1  ORF type:complete len:794 (-),score=218.74 TRINITY_DN16939_c0_g2_i2:249-2630(-)